MAILKKLKSLSANSEGVVAIIVALLVLAFVGMTALVVDMGSLYQDRGSLQNVADAAALAGAQELPLSPAIATQKATEYVTKNRADISSINIQISSENGYPNDTITVTVNNPSSSIRFGSIFGSSSANVKATAKAIVGTPESIPGGIVVPWGVIQNVWVPGQPYDLDSGKFGPLTFAGQGSGGNVYRNNIANGYDGILDLGDPIEIDFLTGFKSGPTNQGTESRVGPVGSLDRFSDLTEPAAGGFRLLKPDSQFVLCPIVTQATANIGHGPIVGFAPFIITYYDGKTVTGTFLNEALIVTTGSVGSYNPTGIKVIRLIQ